MMQRILIYVAIMLGFVGTYKLSLATQTTLTDMPSLKVGNAVSVIGTNVQGNTAKQQAMNTELYAADLLKANTSCFANAAAANACSILNWLSIDASGFNGNLATTDDTLQEIAQKVDDLALGSGVAALPTWMPSTAPTNGRQIMQAVGGCSLSTYDNRADCEAHSGTWTTPTYQHTSIISGLINDTGTADDDLWSAAKITSELSGKQSVLGFDPQPELGFTPENTANKGVANGYAGLGSDGKIPVSQLNQQPSTLILTTDTVLTEAQILDNKYISNYGASGEVDLVLPAPSYTVSRTIMVEASQIIEICPPSGELFDLSGTDLTVDYCIDNPPTPGSKAVFTRTRTGASTYKWSVDVIRGTWVDAGVSD